MLVAKYSMELDNRPMDKAKYIKMLFMSALMPIPVVPRSLKFICMCLSNIISWPSVAYQVIVIPDFVLVLLGMPFLLFFPPSIPCPARSCCCISNILNLASMEMGQLLALLCQSLVLASA